MENTTREPYERGQTQKEWNEDLSPPGILWSPFGPEQDSGSHRQIVDLAWVMQFHFYPLIHRMVDKYGWKEEEAVQCFEDTKKYLYFCATYAVPIAPPPKIDEMWHNFILFTMDYEEFCLTRFGRFIHHRPRRRGESLEGKVLNAASVARATFGTISDSWGNSEGPSDDCGSCMSCKSCHN